MELILLLLYTEASNMNLNKISRYIPTIHCMSQSKDAIIYNTHNFSD